MPRCAGGGRGCAGRRPLRCGSARRSWPGCPGPAAARRRWPGADGRQPVWWSRVSMVRPASAASCRARRLGAGERSARLDQPAGPAGAPSRAGGGRGGDERGRRAEGSGRSIGSTLAPARLHAVRGVPTGDRLAKRSSPVWGVSTSVPGSTWSGRPRGGPAAPAWRHRGPDVATVCSPTGRPRTTAGRRTWPLRPSRSAGLTATSRATTVGSSRVAANRSTAARAARARPVRSGTTVRRRRPGTAAAGRTGCPRRRRARRRWRRPRWRRRCRGRG